MMDHMVRSSRHRFILPGLATAMAVLACGPLGGGSAPADSPDQAPDTQDPGMVAGWVWLDANEDGIQDEFETGMPNVEVRLQSTDLAYTDTFRTLQDGMFEFTEVPPGEYTLDFTPPGDMDISPINRGDDDSLDSDADADGETAPFIVGSGQVVDNQDAGVFEMVQATPTPLIYVPGGEWPIKGEFTNGAGDCGSTADFSVPNLILRVDGTDAEVDQPPIHHNTGSYDPNTQTIDVSTGEGEGTEGYHITLLGEFEFGKSTYRYTTATGTCTWDVDLELVPQ